MKRRALGKGLSSLIPATGADLTPPVDQTLTRPPVQPRPQAATSRETPQGGQGDRVAEIEIDKISENPRQPRQTMTSELLHELAASIKATGVIQPILVRPHNGRYQVVAGERRWRAAKLAGLGKIPAVVRHIPDERLLEIALIENIQRQELNPIEEARAYKTLRRERDLSQEELADLVGKDRATVANVMRLLTLPDTVKSRVEKGTVSMGHARALLGLMDPNAQNKISQDIENKGLSVRQVEDIVRRAKTPTKPKEAAPRDPNLVSAEEDLARRLGTKVRIEQNRAGKGRMLIEFYSNEELIRIYEAIAGS